MLDKLEFLSDISSNYITKNEVIEDGVLILETDTRLFKLGNGIDRYNSLPYLELSQYSKQWKVNILSQTGTGDPEFLIVKDTIKGIDFYRSDVGVYFIDKVDGFPSGKSTPFKKVEYIDPDGNRLTLEPTSESRFTLKTYAAIDTEVLADGVLVNQELNIEVFNI